MTAPDTTAARAKLAEEIREQVTTSWGFLHNTPTVLLSNEQLDLIRAALLTPAAALPEGPTARDLLDAMKNIELRGPQRDLMVVHDLINEVPLAASPEPPAPSAAGAWLDISTAPMDATPVLLFWPWLERDAEVGHPGFAVVDIGFWGRVPGSVFHWMRGGRWTPGCDPTHWQPLPLPPNPTAAIPPGAETTEVGR